MYKLKRVLLIGLILSFTISLWGCHNRAIGTSRNKSVASMLQNLKNYEADVSITFTKNKDKSNIKMNHVYDKEGKYQMTIIEPKRLNGYTTVCDGTKVSEYNPITEKSMQIEVSPVKNQLLFGTFLHNYLNDESAQIVEEQLDGQNVYAVTVPIAGEFKYMATEKVWFDYKTTYPIKMEIYDTEGSLTIRIDFVNFIYNPVK